MTTVLEFNANEIIKDALEDTGIIPPGQNAPPALQDKCLRIMNRLLKEWQAGPTRLWLQDEGVVFINPGQQSYLLGPSGDFACDADNVVSTALAADMEAGEQNLQVESTEGMLAPGGLLDFDPINAELWRTFKAAVVEVLVFDNEVPNIVVTNTEPVGGGAFLEIELPEDGENFTVQIDNTSGDTTAIYSIQNPADPLTGRTILSTGDNDFGQLAQRNTIPLASFTEENDFRDDWAVMAAGKAHALAVRQDGTLWGVGSNSNGQLGFDTDDLTKSEEYIRIGTDHDWAYVGAGELFSVAIKTDGTLWSTGFNEYGQLGTGHFDELHVFTQEFNKRTDFVEVTCGDNHAMAKTDTGAVYSIGDNSVGQLGTNTPTNELDFVEEEHTLRDWKHTAAGANYTMAINSLSQLYGTGDNSLGQFGNGTHNSTEDFRNLNADFPVVKVACGDSFTYVLDNEGILYAAGDNTYGQLANGTTDSNPFFRPISNEPEQSIMSAGGAISTLMITHDGELWGCGDNTHGQLGLGATSGVKSFTKVGTDTWKYIACGSNFAVGINSDDELWGTGNNDNGQLGLNNTTQQTTFTKIDDVKTWLQVSCGFDHTMALDSNEEIWGTGNNDTGQIGQPEATTQVLVLTRESTTGTSWKFVSCGFDFTMAISGTNGEIFGTGTGQDGQLSIPYGENGLWFGFHQGYTPFNSLIKDISVSLDGGFTCVILDDGTLWSTGNNSDGQLGIGDTIYYNGTNSPSKIDFFAQEKNGWTDWVSVSCGASHILGIREDNNIYGAGTGSNGELLGRGGNTRKIPNSNTFGACSLASGGVWKKAIAGNKVSAAIKIDNTLFTAGIDNASEIAQNNAYQHTNTAQGINISSSFSEGLLPYSAIKMASYGKDFCVFVTEDGALYGMGNNSNHNFSPSNTTEFDLPILIDDGFAEPWVHVTCGQEFTLILSQGGHLSGIGRNSEGQLGLGNYTSPIDSYTVISKFTSNPVLTVEAGDQFSAVITYQNVIYTTGQNEKGQLGRNNSGDTRNTFEELYYGGRSGGLIDNTPIQIACGSQHMMAMNSLGQLFGAGWNQQNQLGLGSGAPDEQIEFEIEARQLIWSTGPKSFGCGYQHSMAVHHTGTLLGAGNNELGQCGADDGDDDLQKFEDCGDGRLYIDIDASNNASIGRLESNSTLMGTGQSSGGLLAGATSIGGTLFSFTDMKTTQLPGPDGTPPDFFTIGENNSLYTTLTPSVDSPLYLQNGNLFTVGSNQKGQLGVAKNVPSGSGNNYNQWQIVSGPTPAQDVAFTNSAMLVLLTSGYLVGASPQQNANEIGVVDRISNQVLQPTINKGDFVRIAAGASFTLASDAVHGLWGTGDNGFGQFGNGTKTGSQVYIQLGTYTISAITCGSSHSALLVGDGILYAGDNSGGQCDQGDGSPQNLLNFTLGTTDVPTTGVVAGGLTTLSVTTEDNGLLPTLRVCGDNENGSLGMGTSKSYPTMKRTYGINGGIAKISCGTNHTMMITALSELWGFGSNNAGQLGTNGAVSELPLQEIGETNDWAAVSANQNVSVGLREVSGLSTYTLYSTGWNDVGQLGINRNFTESLYFRQEFYKYTDWNRVNNVQGKFCLSQRNNNRLNGTGDNSKSQLGLSRDSPQTLVYQHATEDLPKVIDIACGANHGIMIREGGALYTVGSNSHGQLAVDDNSVKQASFFNRESTDATDWGEIGGGKFHTMARKTSGANDKTIWGAGANDFGQLGLSSGTASTFKFVQESTTASDWVQFSCGGFHTMAINGNDWLFGTGLNKFGQIGQDSTEDSYGFVRESEDTTNYTSVGCGKNHSIAKTEQGKVFGAGSNATGQLGLNLLSQALKFTEIGAITLWTDITGGDSHSALLQEITGGGNDSLWTAGSNQYGQLGIGHKSVLDQYAQESLDKIWSVVSCKGNSSIAVEKDLHQLYGTGLNDKGQLGISNQNINVRQFTIEVNGDTDWIDAACGGGHTLAIKIGNYLFGVGDNSNSQLGILNTINQSVFVQEASEGDNWVSIAANAGFSLAITHTGQLWGCGKNSAGQLGLGENTLDIIEYTREIELSTTWESVSAGLNFTVATQLDNFFENIVEVSTSEDGDIFLPFSRSASTPELTSIYVVMTIGDADEHASISLDKLQMYDRDALGNFVGVQQDDNTRHWGNVVEVISDTEVAISTGLTASAVLGSSVFTFTDLIDRPLQLYNGRRTIFSGTGNDAEIPVEDWSREEYMKQAIKYSLGPTSRMYYNPTLTDGTLYTWQTGTTVNQLLKFTYNKPFEVLEHQTDEPQIPAEWAMALKWNIAAQLITGHGIDQVVAAQITTNAQESLKTARSDWSPYAMQLNPLGRR